MQSCGYMTISTFDMCFSVAVFALERANMTDRTEQTS